MISENKKCVKFDFNNLSTSSKEYLSKIQTQKLGSPTKRKTLDKQEVEHDNRKLDQREPKNHETREVELRQLTPIDKLRGSLTDKNKNKKNGSEIRETQSLQQFSTVSWERQKDTVVINVSGELFETYMETLNRFPNTLLGDQKTREKFLNQDGHLFFNRSSEAFESILYYYQSHGHMYYDHTALPLNRFIQVGSIREIGVKKGPKSGKDLGV